MQVEKRYVPLINTCLELFNVRLQPAVQDSIPDTVISVPFPSIPVVVVRLRFWTLEDVLSIYVRRSLAYLCPPLSLLPSLSLNS